MKRLNFITFIFLTIIVYSCEKKNGGEPAPPPAPAPEAAVLISPSKDSECLDGDSVVFQWSESANTDSYDITIKNLLTQSVQSQTGLATTTVTISLEKGNPYSWYITSRSNDSSESTSSDKWKFYLKGEPVSNYSPFPADLITPKSESSVNAGSIKFEWNASDADGDDLTYDVYLDSSNPPSTRIKTSYNSNNLNHTINDSGTYYWKIISKDNNGGNSDSGVSKFKVVD